VEENLIPNKKAKLDEESFENLIGNFEQLTPENIKKFSTFFADVIEKGRLDRSAMECIAKSIGNCISDNIYNDCIRLEANYTDPKCLTDFDCNIWLKERDAVLTSFLAAAANCVISEKLDQKMLCITGAVDSIYKARKLNHVAPLPFAQNLISYYITGSKTVTLLNNRQQASGSYTTLRKWLNDCGKHVERNENVQLSDKIIFFDNNQVVARNWRVTYGHKTTCSVITTTINISPNPEYKLQHNKDLSPRNWLHSADNKCVNQIMNLIKDGEQQYSLIQQQYIQTRLEKVMNEKRIGNDGFLIDFIDDNLSGKVQK
jgi:hypothetical protein